jgi:2-polyprenyl-6-methoxyphenol hydroxylase-like FAD-dependent oxidoreductase
MGKITKVLIVGGGIGGLSSGIALRKLGLEVTLAEIQPSFNVYGVGIIQPSNALRALDSLGVADKCMERGSPYGMVKMFTSHGHFITEVGVPPIGRLPSHNGISRKILHDVLYEEAVAKGVNFRMGLTVNEIDNGKEKVTITFSDGSRGEYDLLLGADGVNSKMRKLIFGDYTPTYTGQSVWRYAFDRPAELETGHMFMGRNSKVGLIPMTKNTMYMFLVTAEGDDPRIPEVHLIPRFKEWLKEYEVPIVKGCIKKITDPNMVVYRPLETLFMPAPWYKNRVLIIGDAVHATIPQLGQGAGLALEDSIVLAELIQQENPLEVTLEKFMQRRLDRCKMVVEASKQVGELEQLEWKGLLPKEVNIGAIMGKTLGAMMQPV